MEWGQRIFVFLVYITGSFSVPVRVPVEGSVGYSVILPCSVPESEVQGKIEEFNVHWRDDEGNEVCDITGHNRTVEVQAPKYMNRVDTFPEERKKGNFSIKLNALQKTDARKYYCHITGPSQNYLIITDLKVEDGPVGRGNHGELSLIVMLISFLFTCILLFI